MTPPSRSGNKTDRDALRLSMTTAGCAPGEIAAEMRARFRMRPREAWRHALGWTLQETAERISVLPGYSIAADASLVGKWEKWPGPSSRRPSVSVLFATAVAMGCTAQDLLDLEDYQALPEQDLRVLRAPAQTAPLPAHTAITPTAPPPSERPEDAVRSAAGESAAWAQWAETTNVGEIALEQIHADVRALAQDYLTGDAIELFHQARVARDRVFTLLEGHQPPGTTADLYVAAGYLCGLLAWISSDLGNLRAADTQGRTAWLCAEMSGHNDLRAWVASTRSKVAFWDGRLRDAIQHARRGASYQPRGSVGALLACQEADAWSKLGAVNETQLALRRADEAREHPGQDAIGGIFSCSPGRQENYTAGAHLRIENYAEALTEADSALAHLRAQPVRAYGTEAQIHISRATALVGTGHPEGVLPALAPVLAMPPEQRLDPITKRVVELGDLLARDRAARGAAASAARRVLHDWCLDSAPRHLALSPRQCTT
ncbi:helix-turn-helix transcriptional regulator [Streptomyces sp. NPDC002221]|uniref:helix-turn-helix transcriptional regulator n=1 Tax=Streptomyces sp. NPDC002221 TaxID=3364639 RepID=UPI0036C63F91